MKIKTTVMIGLLAIVLLSLTGCPNPNPNPDNSTNTTYYFEEYLLAKDNEVLSPQECSARKLDDKVLILHSQKCGHCIALMPTLKALEEEFGLQFKYYDLYLEEDQTALEEFKLKVKYTPTVVIGCKVYVGAKTEAFYRTALNKFVQEQTG